MAIVTCPGCGVQLPSEGLPPSDRYNASGECFKLCTELSANMLYDARFILQHIVDAYGAQHSGGNTKHITTVFSLIGLCLALEHNYSGKQVQNVHARIPKQVWPQLEPPVNPGSVKIPEVINQTTDLETEKWIKAWATSVWNSWSHYHDWIREKTRAYMMV